VNWGPASLDLADRPGFGPIGEHLSRLRDFFGMPFDEVNAWKPTAVELERIAFALQHGSTRQLLAALQASADRSTTLPLTPGYRRPRKRSVVMSERDWLHIDPRASDAIRRKKTWERWHARLRAELIKPLQQLAGDTKHPVERAMVQLLAKLAAVTLPEAALIAYDCRRATAEGEMQGPVGYRHELDRLLRLVDRFRGVSSEIRAWKTQRKDARQGPKTLPRIQKSASKNSA
jgi:hypothetical protein